MARTLYCLRWMALALVLVTAPAALAQTAGPVCPPSGATSCDQAGFMAIYGWVPGIGATVGVGNFETTVSQSILGRAPQLQRRRDGALRIGREDELHFGRDVF